MSTKVSKIKETGATFTPVGLATFLAKKILSYSKKDNIEILDPACGDGSLLTAIANELNKNNSNFRIKGYDSNIDYLDLSNSNLKDLQVKNVDLFHQDFLDTVELKKDQLSLFNSEKKYNSINDSADIVIANPPYVRTQILGSEKAQLLAKKFNLKGRVDLYYPFLIAMTHALKKGGIIGVITSNRYISTKSGESIRKFLNEHYEILEVIDLGDTKLFDAAVLPAIFIGKKILNPKNKVAKFTKIYEELNGYSGELNKANNIYEILNKEEDGYYITEEKKYKKSSGALKLGSSKNSWTMLSKKETEWVSRIEKKALYKVGDLFKVRVGIKTTADKVFIRDDWDSLGIEKPEDEVLRDLISQENITSWKMCKKKKLRVLYTHTLKNNVKDVIDLNKYKKANNYLRKFEEQLKGRKYLIEAGRNWFEIWVPQNPALWNKPKLVFPDISVTPRFLYDNTGKIVNGNCYWMVAEKDEDKDTLLFIQGIANSNLMTKYHDLVFNNKLYSGRRRYFSQYVENYPLPDLKSKEFISIVNIVKKINKNDEVHLNPSLIEKLEIEVAKSFNVEPIFTLD